MADRHHSVRLPPDSTGKRIPHDAEIIVAYDNGVYAFSDLDNVVFETSTVAGYITMIEGTTVSGVIHVILDEGEDEVAAVIQDGENIQVGGVTYATVNGTPSETYYYPMTLIAGGEKPHQHANVDRYGSLQIQPAQGDFQIGPTGRLKTSDETILGVYDFREFTLPSIVSTTSAGSGSQSSDLTFGANKYQVSSASGDSIRRRTDVYHLAEPNFPLHISTMIQLGDQGKEGLIRRWGYFDDNDGIFFKLENTILSVVVRSSTSGSVVETEFIQSEWNRDRVDGNGGTFNISELTLDVSKVNYYWISVSKSSCTISWGVRAGGRKITLHTYCYTNVVTTPVTNTFDLPLSWQMDTTAVVASASEMKVVYGEVVAEIANYDVAKNARNLSVEHSSLGSDWTPIASIRPLATIYGLPNRAWLIPHKIKLHSTDQTVLFRVKIGNTLSGESWTTYTNAAEYDVDSTSSSGGIELYSGMADAGKTANETIIASGDVKPLTTKITTRADVTDDPFHFTLEARTITGITNLYLSVIHFEVY